METSLCGDLPVCVQGTLWMAAVYKDVSALAKTNMELGFAVAVYNRSTLVQDVSALCTE